MPRTVMGECADFSPRKACESQTVASARPILTLTLNKKHDNSSFGVKFNSDGSTIVVAECARGLAAHDAGLRITDNIIAIDGVVPEGASHACSLLTKAAGGSTITMVVARNIVQSI